MRYTINSDGSQSNLTAFINGEVYACDSSNPYWSEIMDAVRANDGALIPFFIDLAERAAQQFRKVTDRVAVNFGTVTFDGDVVDNSLTHAILRAMNSGDDFTPLVNFMEKVYQNPNKHSRESLYTWLSDRDFTITTDGDLVCYKGISTDGLSTHSGPGIVNGVHQNGRLDNSVGNVVEMKRSQVTHDPATLCSAGLHVATFDYANSWDSRTVKVIVNPRDVVSVPTDGAGDKMRVCRYRVAEEISAPVNSFIDTATFDEWDDEPYEGYVR